MAGISLENMNLLCRICGTIPSDHKLLSTSREDDSLNEVAEKIILYLPIKFSNDDKLPKQICTECKNKIISWDKFYRRCEDTNEKFKSILLKDSNFIKENSIVEKIIDETSNTRRNNGDLPQYSTEEFPEDSNDVLKNYHSDKIFHCDICNQKKPLDDFISHMTLHALESNKTDTEAKNGKTIIDNQNNDMNTSVKCLKCPKQFKNLKAMKYHFRMVHKNTNNFQCDSCDKSFSRNRLLANHMNSIHGRGVKLECNQCKKLFKTDSSLYSHQRTHSNIKMFTCSECDKGFKFKHQLDEHFIVMHTKEKKFNCNMCRKRFATQDNLTKHKKTHSNTCDFTCHICGVQVKLKRYLHEHIKRVHRAVFARK